MSEQQRGPSQAESGNPFDLDFTASMTTEQYDAAEASCLEQLPASPAMHFYLAAVYSAKGNPQAAEAHIAEAIKAFHLDEYLRHFNSLASTNEEVATKLFRTQLHERLVSLGVPAAIVRCVSAFIENEAPRLSVTFAPSEDESIEEALTPEDLESLVDIHFARNLKTAREVGVDEARLQELVKQSLAPYYLAAGKAGESLELAIQRARRNDPNTPDDVKARIQSEMDYLRYTVFYRD